MTHSDIQTLRTAANLISGQFENDVTPASVAAVIDALTAMAMAAERSVSPPPSQPMQEDGPDRMKFEKWFFTGGVKFDQLNIFGIAQEAWRASAASRSNNPG